MLIKKSLNWIVILGLLIGVCAPVVAQPMAGQAHAHPLLYSLAAHQPDQTVQVIVQKSGNGDGVERLARSLGAHITKNLDMIRAFAAQMTAAQALALARHPDVRWVSLDAPTVRSATSTLTLLDDFRTGNFSGSSGSAPWDGAWQEAGESDGPSYGRLKVVSSSNCDYGNCLRIGYDGWLSNYSISRAANLSGAASAVLSFNFRRYINWWGGDVAVQVSGDGGSNWATLAEYDLVVRDYFPVSQSFDISSYISSKTRIRFLGSGYASGYIYFDSIRIDYQMPQTPNYFLATTGADQLHTEGLTGQGVTVAVVDSGVYSHADVNGRLLAPLGANDEYGHGTHVAGIVGGSGSLAAGSYVGMAPGVNLVSLKVADANGMAYESDVVNALQWIFDNHTAYNIRVANLSLNSTIEDSYHTSPLDAAVEILWFNGVTVVVSAGNKGPGGGYNTARTAPGNDPFVITVGAADEHGTPDFSDDTIAPFSAFGTTVDGYLKPDILAPGYNIVSLLSAQSIWGAAYPEKVVEGQYIRLSGTSMAAPMVSGAAALLLQDEPGLTPDQVKYRLLHSTSRSLVNAAGSYPYLDVYAAVHVASQDSANFGQIASQLLWTGSDPVTWGSVAWNSVAWNSVAWNSVAWNSVAWNSVSLDGIFWERGKPNRGHGH